MQLLHLYYFKLLAENEHLLNTAKIIHITPPALSTTISRLEDELQVSLFDRVGARLSSTKTGKFYISMYAISFPNWIISSANYPRPRPPKKISYMWVSPRSRSGPKSSAPL